MHKVPDTRTRVLGITGIFVCSSIGSIEWFWHVLHYIHIKELSSIGTLEMFQY